MGTKATAPFAGKRPYRMPALAEAAEATLNRVLDAAVELFTDSPYEEVSLDLVARRRGEVAEGFARAGGAQAAADAVESLLVAGGGVSAVGWRAPQLTDGTSRSPSNPPQPQAHLTPK